MATLIRTLALLAFAGLLVAAGPVAESAPSGRATLVVTAVPIPAEMGAVKQYLQGVGATFQKAGGTLVRRLKTAKVVNGRAAGMVLVMDFPSATAASEAFETEAYKALLPLRDRGFSEMSILITHGM